jgi:hypothetical protein
MIFSANMGAQSSLKSTSLNAAISHKLSIKEFISFPFYILPYSGWNEQNYNMTLSTTGAKNVSPVLDCIHRSLALSRVFPSFFL